MKELIEILVKACIVVWILIATLSFAVLLPCLKEIFHVTERQGNFIVLAVVLWILVPPILFAAIGGVKTIKISCRNSHSK